MDFFCNIVFELHGAGTNASGERFQSIFFCSLADDSRPKDALSFVADIGLVV